MKMVKARLTRHQMAARLAKEFQNGWVVNLGIGIPTLCSNYSYGDHNVIFQSENGVIGYGPLLPEGQEDIHLVNAGGQYVSLLPGASVMHHADSFALIRGGHIDVAVLGSYEVSENGDFANWKILGRKGGGIGGAMDLAVGAKQVFIVMQHTTRDGKPRLVKKLNLPPTALGVVTLVMTDLGLFEITTSGFVLREIAPGYEPKQIQDLTEAQLLISNDLRRVAI